MRHVEPVLSPAQRTRFAITLVLLFIIILIASCGGCQAPMYVREMPTTADPAVIQMKIVDKDGDSETCTAWKLDDERIATAGHCCHDDAIAYWGIGPHAVMGEMFDKLLDNDDEDYDLCILRGTITGAPLVLATHDPAKGEHVWTVGYPGGVFLISGGYWSGRRNNRAIASVTSYPGASGSPAFNEYGEVVGVIIQYYPEMDNLAYMSPIERVRTMKALAR